MLLGHTKNYIDSTIYYISACSILKASLLYKEKYYEMSTWALFITLFF